MDDKNESIKRKLRKIKKSRVPQYELDLTGSPKNAILNFWGGLSYYKDVPFSNTKLKDDQTYLSVIINVIYPGSPNPEGIYLEVFQNYEGEIMELVFDPKNNDDEDFIDLLDDDCVQRGIILSTTEDKQLE